MSDGRLAPCPASPNCVCSEQCAGESRSFVAPIALAGDPRAAWQAAKDALAAMGGTVEREEGAYLAATFRSRVFGFVDDVELRLDSEKRLLQVRSAARSGFYDFGVNRRRVEDLRERLGGR